MRYLAIAVLLFGLSACHHFENKEAPFYSLPIFYEKPEQAYRVIGLVNAAAEQHKSEEYILRQRVYAMGGDAALVMSADPMPTSVNSYGRVGYTRVLRAQVIKFDKNP